jgi:hypothetical protein
MHRTHNKLNPGRRQSQAIFFDEFGGRQLLDQSPDARGLEKVVHLGQGPCMTTLVICGLPSSAAL